MKIKKLLSAWILFALPALADSPQLLTLGWDAQSDTDTFYLYGTNSLSGAPLYHEQPYTNFLGQLGTNLVMNWPPIANVSGATTVSITVRPGQFFYFVTASNAWGESVPSNVLRMPSVSSNVTGVRINSLRK